MGPRGERRRGGGRGGGDPPRQSGIGRVPRPGTQQLRIQKGEIPWDPEFGEEPEVAEDDQGPDDPDEPTWEGEEGYEEEYPHEKDEELSADEIKSDEGVNGPTGPLTFLGVTARKGKVRRSRTSQQSVHRGWGNLLGGYDHSDGPDGLGAVVRRDGAGARPTGAALQQTLSGDARSRTMRLSAPIENMTGANPTTSITFKERDEVKFNPAPAPQYLRTWRPDCCRKVQEASGRPGYLLQRMTMLAFETEEQYPEENLWLSEKCPELATLSPKILKACILIMPGELKRRMVLMREEAFNLGRDIPGLVALRQISNWYRTNGRAHIVQDHRHLEQLRIKNGDLAA